jgi:hypothetical protein
MLRFEASADRFDAGALRARAERFDRPRFAREMQDWIDRRWAEFCQRGGDAGARC